MYEEKCCKIDKTNVKMENVLLKICKVEITFNDYGCLPIMKKNICVCVLECNFRMNAC